VEGLPRGLRFDDSNVVRGELLGQHDAVRHASEAVARGPLLDDLKPLGPSPVEAVADLDRDLTLHRFAPRASRLNQQ
jgi:hypothetical protein